MKKGKPTKSKESPKAKQKSPPRKPVEKKPKSKSKIKPTRPSAQDAAAVVAKYGMIAPNPKPKPEDATSPTYKIGDVVIVYGLSRCTLTAISGDVFQFQPVGSDKTIERFSVLREHLAEAIKPAPPLRELLPIHPLANRLPWMTDAEYAGLVESIRATGQTDDVILVDGKILDGRNRDKACVELGLVTRTEEFDPLKHHAATPLDYILAKACHRNMTPGQRACVAEEFMDDMTPTRKTGRPTENERKIALDSGIIGKSSEIAAKRFGVSARNVEEVRRIKSEDVVLYQSIFSGAIKVNQASNRLKQKTNAAAVHDLSDIPITFKPADCRLLHGDNITLMKELKADGKSFTTIFADPQYNNGWSYDSDPTHDSIPAEKYQDFTRRWIKAAANLLTEDGSIYVLIDDANSDHVGLALRDAGLHRRGCIVWWESFANHTPGSFTCCTRYIHYYTKHPTKYIWTPEMVRSARQDYGDVRANPAGKVPDNVWPISRKTGTSADRVPFEDAPPQLPESIPTRCILASSRPNDAILDPFNGNGTSGIAALRNGRTYVGLDRSKLYLDQSMKWIKSQLNPAKEGAKAS